jgi:hypothetical protein
MPELENAAELRPRRKPDLNSPLFAGKLTEQGYGDAVGKSLRTIRRWITQGLPVEGHGTLRIIDIEQARAWHASQRSGGLAPPRRRARNARR